MSMKMVIFSIKINTIFPNIINITVSISISIFLNINIILALDLLLTPRIAHPFVLSAVLITHLPPTNTDYLSINLPSNLHPVCIHLSTILPSYLLTTHWISMPVFLERATQNMCLLL